MRTEIEMRGGHRLIATFALVTLVGGCTNGVGTPSVSGTAAGGSAPVAAATASASAAIATPRPTASRLPPSAAPAESVPLYDPTADARSAIRAAVAAAKSDGKLVLIDFGADWCPDCHLLAAYLHGPAGQALVDASFHVVSVDVGYWDHNLDVVKSYGDAISNGIPSVVVLDGDGKVVGSTKDGTLANARMMSETAVLAVLADLAR